MSAKRNNGGGEPKGGFGRLAALAEGVFLSALVAGGGYLLSPAGVDVFSGAAEKALPKRAPAAETAASAVEGRDLAGDRRPGKAKAGSGKPKRAAEAGAERRSVGEVLGGPEFKGGGSGALKVSLMNSKPGASAAPAAAPAAVSLASAGGAATSVAAEAPPAAAGVRPLEAVAAPPPVMVLASAAGSAKAGADRPQKKPSEARPTPLGLPPAARASRPAAALLLEKVSGRLADRGDLSVSMSIEMRFGEDSALRKELEFKRDVLAAAAAAALRRHEYGNVNTAVLKADILETFNGQLRTGKLSGVDIIDFSVRQVSAR